MLNEERVILMTQMASYEDGEGKENVKIGNYFRSDYIAIQVLKAIVCGTIAFLVAFGLYVIYDMETFMQELYNTELILSIVKKAVTYYVVTVVSYSVLTYIVSTYKYMKAKKNLKKYYNNLKKLNSLYGVETEPKKKAGGRK